MLRSYLEVSLEPLAVTVQEACNALSIGRTKAYDLINQGRLKTIEVGNWPAGYFVPA